MKAIGLVRVSTVVQDLEQQTTIVRQEILKDGYQDDDEHIILIKDRESAVQLSEEERQGLTKMKELIEQDPEINCVYIYELSRLSRQPGILYSIRDWLISKQVNLICIKPYMKLLEDGRLSDTASIMFSIFGALSEQEGYLRKERTSRGKRKAQLEGKSLGNWLPLGYATDENRYIIVDEKAANLVQKIFHMCVNENKSTVIIARELSDSGEFPTRTSIRAHSSSILNILRNTAYIGKAPFNQKRQKENYNQYPRIISDELFYSAQELLSSRKKNPKTSHKNIYYCKGLLKDKNSGKILKASPCVASYSFFSDRDDTIRYRPISVPINLFDSFVWHLTQRWLESNDTTRIEDIKNELRKKHRQFIAKERTSRIKMIELRNREYRIQERIVSGRMSETMGDAMLEELKREINIQSENRARFENEALAVYEQYIRYTNGSESRAAIASNNDQDKYDLIHECIREIIVEKSGIPDNGITRKPGLGVKYGTMQITYENGIVEQYKFNSYTKKCFTLDDVEVPFEYVLRIKGQQHQPNYSLKKKKKSR